jgi:hypothetical protein
MKSEPNRAVSLLDIAVALLWGTGYAAASVVLDLLYFRHLDWVAMNALRVLPPDVGPAWLALPRLLVFLVIGVSLSRVASRLLVFRSCVYATLIVLYFLMKLGLTDRLWIPDEPFSNLLVVVPLTAVPVGFVAGVVLDRRWYRHRSALKRAEPRKQWVWTAWLGIPLAYLALTTVMYSFTDTGTGRLRHSTMAGVYWPLLTLLLVSAGTWMVAQSFLKHRWVAPVYALGMGLSLATLQAVVSCRVGSCLYGS